MASSFLTFPWRRHQMASSRSQQKTSSDAREGPPPLRRFSSSTTSGRDFSSGSHLSEGVIEEQQITAPTTAGEDHYTLKIPKHPSTCATPEGLRPRRTHNLVREELGLSGILPSVPSASTDSNDDHDGEIDNLSFVRDEEEDEHEPLSSSYGVLPPRNTATDRSWSSAISTGQLNQQNVMASPPVSTNSFYGHSTDGTIAASPQLYPGQARTAVGAIVALQQHAQQQGSCASSVATQSIQSLEQSEQRLLPPPHEVQDDDDEEEDWHYYDEFDGVDSPPRSHRNGREPDDSTIDDENEQPAYYALDDPITNARSPIPPPPRQGKMTPTRKAGVKDASIEYSPISTGSSLLGSPSSRAGLRNRVMGTAAASRIAGDEEAQHHILPPLTEASSSFVRGYDFGPLAGSTLLATAEHPNNLSAMSEQASVGRRVILSCTDANSERDAKDEAYDKYLIESSRELQSYCPPLDGALLKTKTLNQRRAKESLLMAALERLRDDLQVIADLDANAALGVDDLWLVKTPLNERGILTGFSKEQRTQISDSFAILLKSMQVAQPEEFLLSSPSEVPNYAETHDDLYDSLQFCRRLVEFEKSDPLCGQWKFRARSALGLIPPESPEVRGGDTSLFSLPESETPMTSNVSLTTTITSAVLTPQRQQHHHSRGHHHAQHQQRPAMNGLVVRRTIELFTTRLQEMTAVCVDLLKSSSSDKNNNEPTTKPKEWSLSTKESLRITETVKRTYLQLLAIDRHDLKAVVDSFEQHDEQGENMPPPSTMTVVHHHHRYNSRTAAMTLPPPPPLMFSAPPPLPLHHQPEEPQVENGDCDDQDHNVDDDDDDDDDVYVVDDLRRQMGSVDYDDQLELRDAAPGDERE